MNQQRARRFRTARDAEIYVSSSLALNDLQVLLISIILSTCYMQYICRLFIVSEAFISLPRS